MISKINIIKSILIEILNNCANNKLTTNDKKKPNWNKGLIKNDNVHINTSQNTVNIYMKDTAIEFIRIKHINT